LKVLNPNYWPSYARANRLRILMYHSISNVSGDRFAVKPEQFAAQMQVLAAQRFDVVSLEEGYRRLSFAKDLARTVALTFDDGHRDFLTAAAPILQQHGFSATLFVVTGSLGSTASWMSTGKAGNLLSRDELCELKSQGFRLGSHTVTHSDLTTLDSTTLERELIDSRATIGEMGETFVPFAYPGGMFTKRERDAVKRAGYNCAVIVGGRWGNGPETDRFLLKREPMLASDSLDWFKKRVNGFYEAHYLMARARGIETR
jgi:peptidoglycan/xylan/chitin deacetylase (PgdA/CDA1 family)